LAVKLAFAGLSVVLSISVLAYDVGAHQSNGGCDVADAGGAVDLQRDHDERECEHEADRGHNVLFHWRFHPFKTAVFQRLFFD